MFWGCLPTADHPLLGSSSTSAGARTSLKLLPVSDMCFPSDRKRKAVYPWSRPQRAATSLLVLASFERKRNSGCKKSSRTHPLQIFGLSPPSGLHTTKHSLESSTCIRILEVCNDGQVVKLRVSLPKNKVSLLFSQGKEETPLQCVSSVPSLCNIYFSE